MKSKLIHLKLYGIKTIAAANRYLEETFLSKINEKFSIAPKEIKNYHRDATPYGDLDEILCWSYKRQLRNDWSIQFKREYFQLKKPEGNMLQPGEFITIRKYLDGTMRFWYGDYALAHYPLSRKPEPPSRSKKYYIPKGKCDSQVGSQIAKKNKHKSPWSQFNPDWLSKKKSTTEICDLL